MSEEWREVPDWPYEVSSWGRIRRSRGGQGTEAGYVLGCSVNKQTGYLAGLMYDKPRRRPFRLHVEVARAFLGPRPPGLAINHIDGDKLNNRPENLEYVTWGENARHAVRHQLFAVGERIARARLTAEKVREMRRLREDGWPMRPLAERYGVSEEQVSKICARLQWKHVA